MTTLNRAQFEKLYRTGWHNMTDTCCASLSIEHTGDLGEICARVCLHVAQPAELNQDDTIIVLLSSADMFDAVEYFDKLIVNQGE